MDLRSCLLVFSADHGEQYKKPKQIDDANLVGCDRDCMSLALHQQVGCDGDCD